MRTLKQLIFPEGLLVVAALLITRVASLYATIAPVAPTLLAVGIGGGVLLSLRFHRGRLLLLFLIIGAAWLGMTNWLLLPAPGTAVALAALLVPVNFAVLGALTERGAFSTPGLVRTGALVIQAVVVAALLWQADPALGELLQRPLLPELAVPVDVGQPALLAFALALLVFLVLWLREPSPVTRGLIWSSVALLAGFHAAGSHVGFGAATVWLATAALVLTLAVIESSYAMAYRDGLTGLPSRRAFGEAAGALSGPYALAMVDVDHFKQCNDTYGHGVGDQVLRMVAARLEQVSGGKAFRYGGEEFAVLFPGLGVEEALPHCEALREAVEASSFALRKRPRPRKDGARRRGSGRKKAVIGVTISIGVASGATPEQFDDAVRAADRALYKAKETGRNRVEC